MGQATRQSENGIQNSAVSVIVSALEQLPHRRPACAGWRPVGRVLPHANAHLSGGAIRRNRSGIQKRGAVG